MDASARHKILEALLVTFVLLLCVNSQQAVGGSLLFVLQRSKGDVWFSFKGTTYQNNSIVILENIGDGDDALLCKTNQTACCQRSYTGSNMSVLGNWYFPNGTRVPSKHTSSGERWDFYRNRGRMVVRLHRRRGGEEGIYHCMIPDAMNVIQTIYIGVYSASTSVVLRGIPYQNNSIVTLEDIGEGPDALLCITHQTACCRSSDTGNGFVSGNWFFPNGSRVSSKVSSRVANGTSYEEQEFYRTRGQMVVRLHRRRGGIEGIYRCEISDSMNVYQTIYIGVYSANTATITVSSSSIQPTSTLQSDGTTTPPVVIIVAAVVTTLVIFTAAVIILVVLIRRKGTKKNKGNELKLQNAGRQATSADQPLYAVAHVHKEGAPSESEELKEYLDQNNTHEYKVPVKRTPAASEYTLPVKSLKLFTLSKPMFGEMESNPTYQSIDQCRVSPTYANLPQEVTSDGVYSVPQ